MIAKNRKINYLTTLNIIITKLLTKSTKSYNAIYTQYNSEQLTHKVLKNSIHSTDVGITYNDSNFKAVCTE